MALLLHIGALDVFHSVRIALLAFPESVSVKYIGLQFGYSSNATKPKRSPDFTLRAMRFRPSSHLTSIDRANIPEKFS